MRQFNRYAEKTLIAKCASPFLADGWLVRSGAGIGDGGAQPLADGQARLDARFAAEGRLGSAKVVARVYRELPRIDGSIAHRYRVNLLFEPERGASQQIERRVGVDSFEKLPPGERVPLTYLAGDPGTVRLSLSSNRHGGHITRSAALAAGLLTLTILWVIGRRAAAGAKAFRDGERRKARVERVANARLHWTDSAERMGRSLRQNRDVLRRIGPGSKITTIHHSGRGWWIDDLYP